MGREKEQDWERDGMCVCEGVGGGYTEKRTYTREETSSWMTGRHIIESTWDIEGNG